MSEPRASNSSDTTRPLAATEIDQIRGIMLFPDDKKRRESFLAKLVVGRKRAQSEGEPDVTAQLELLEALSRWSQSEMNKSLEQAYIFGHAAGMVALRMFHLEMLRGAFSTEEIKIAPEHLKSLIGDVCDELKPRRTPSWFNNKVWPTYKRVCHLWAASLVETHNLENVFPCVASDLGRFLALATVIEEFCTTHQMPRQVGPWVPRSDIWAVPDGNTEPAAKAAALQKFEEYCAFLSMVIREP